MVGVVILFQVGVAPTGGAAEGFILDHWGMFEHVLLAAFVFEAVVGAGPDALKIVDFALAVARAAAGAIALVFGALGFGAEERDVGQ